MARLRKRIFGIGAVLAVVVLVVAACGGGDPTATPRPTATTRPAATPESTATAAPQAAPDFPNARLGGTLKLATGGDPPTWDGLRESTGQTHDPLMPNYDQLVMFDPNNLDEIVGQVAESWTVSDDGLRWLFTIRRGITFSNGNPLTAQDVAFTYDLIQNPPEDIPSPWIGNLGRVGDITTPDDYTLSLTLTSVDASLLASLAAGPLLIHDKEFVEAEGRARVAQWPPMGSGPFMGLPDGFNRGGVRRASGPLPGVSRGSLRPRADPGRRRGTRASEGAARRCSGGPSAGEALRSTRPTPDRLTPHRRQVAARRT